ncbi:hypothetical protein BHM03_00007650 [Ensete ventricosum]|nr:hypothetical protein BHM03_00007650 [Ensete ventricosum]
MIKPTEGVATIREVTELVKSKEELGEGASTGSPFVQEIQDKPVYLNFHLSTLDGLLRHLRRPDVLSLPLSEAQLECPAEAILSLVL